MNAVAPHTVNISNANFITTYISIQPEPIDMEQQMSGPDSPNGLSIRHESEGWEFESPSDRDIICLKNIDNFTTNLRSKISGVARAQVTLQMLALQQYIQKYIYIHPWL